MEQRSLTKTIVKTSCSSEGVNQRCSSSVRISRYDLFVSKATAGDTGIGTISFRSVRSTSVVCLANLDGAPDHIYLTLLLIQTVKKKKRDENSDYIVWLNPTGTQCLADRSYYGYYSPINSQDSFIACWESDNDQDEDSYNYPYCATYLLDVSNNSDGDLAWNDFGRLTPESNTENNGSYAIPALEYVRNGTGAAVTNGWYMISVHCQGQYDGQDIRRGYSYSFQVNAGEEEEVENDEQSSSSTTIAAPSTSVLITTQTSDHAHTSTAARPVSAPAVPASAVTFATSSASPAGAGAATAGGGGNKPATMRIGLGVGLAFGLPVVLAISGKLAFFFIRRHQRRQKRQQSLSHELTTKKMLTCDPSDRASSELPAYTPPELEGTPC